jgi:hypothetical protein
MVEKQIQGPALATYGRVVLNQLAAKVGSNDNGKGFTSPTKSNG